MNLSFYLPPFDMHNSLSSSPSLKGPTSPFMSFPSTSVMTGSSGGTVHSRASDLIVSIIMMKDLIVSIIMMKEMLESDQWDDCCVRGRYIVRIFEILTKELRRGIMRKKKI